MASAPDWSLSRPTLTVPVAAGADVAAEVGAAAAGVVAVGAAGAVVGAAAGAVVGAGVADGPQAASTSAMSASIYSKAFFMSLLLELSRQAVAKRQSGSRSGTGVMVADDGYRPVTTARRGTLSRVAPAAA